jgi:endoglucanase Acf2
MYKKIIFQNLFIMAIVMPIGCSRSSSVVHFDKFKTSTPGNSPSDTSDPYDVTASIIPATFGNSSYSNFSGTSIASVGLASPKGTSKFVPGLKFTSNKWWSSLGWNFDGASPFSLAMFPHPFAPVIAQGNGLTLGYPSTTTSTSNFFIVNGAGNGDLIAGIAGLSAPDVRVEGYSDWAVNAIWADGTRTLHATIGKGFPYVYFFSSGGAPKLVAQSLNSTQPWYNAKGVIGISINGNSYGIFGPANGNWTSSNDHGNTVLTLNNSNSNYFSVAVLPNEANTGDSSSKLKILEYYRQHAYAAITDTKVSWTYDDSTSNLKTLFSVKTKQMDNDDSSLSVDPLLALYPHQWKNSPQLTSLPTPFTYTTSRGTQMVIAAQNFTTEILFRGILPALMLSNPTPSLMTPSSKTFPTPVYTESPTPHFVPMPGLKAMATPASLADFFYNDLVNLINSPDFGSETYSSGLHIAKVAHLIPIAQELNLMGTRDALIKVVKGQLQYWFNANKDKSKPNYAFNYFSDWSSLVGFPAGFGSDDQLNDHHFHWGYFIMGASLVALFDKAWASDSQYGAMVKMLIRDTANPLRNDPLFPFLRNLDPYEGHSWASGHAHFSDGNNQESSSEAINFASAILLFGENTENKVIRDLGIYLYTTEVAATEQYWFDVDQVNHALPTYYRNFPSASFTHPSVGMIWGSKGDYSTWFSGKPEAIHGINFLPFQGGSLYLGHYPDYIDTNYAGLKSAKNGDIEDLQFWSDIIWNAQVFGVSGRVGDSSALSKFETNKLSYSVEEGETKTHTYHWLSSLTGLGNIDARLTSNFVTAAGFRDSSGTNTYVANNSHCTTRTVQYSDKTQFPVPARSQAIYKNGKIIKTIAFSDLTDCQ